MVSTKARSRYRVEASPQTFVVARSAPEEAAMACTVHKNSPARPWGVVAGFEGEGGARSMPSRSASFFCRSTPSPCRAQPARPRSGPYPSPCERSRHVQHAQRSLPSIFTSMTTDGLRGSAFSLVLCVASEAGLPQANAPPKTSPNETTESGCRLIAPRPIDRAICSA